MQEKNYGIRDVLIGIFNNFPKKNFEDYYYTLNEFFFKNKEKYSVLNELAFDQDTHESKEFWDAWDNLETSWLICYAENDLKWIINKKAIETAYKKFTKKKFNKNELGEIEKLSLEFQKEF